MRKIIKKYLFTPKVPFIQFAWWWAFANVLIFNTHAAFSFMIGIFIIFMIGSVIIELAKEWIDN